MVGVARELAKVRSRLDIGERRLARSERRLRERFYWDYWNRIAGTLHGTCRPYANDLLRLDTPRGLLFVRQQYVQIDDRITLDLAGDKLLSQGLLREAGLPAPRFTLLSRGSSLDPGRIIDDLGGQVVCKPARGAGGKAISTGIREPRELMAAARRAHALCADVIIEEHVEGENYRALYLEGRLIDVVLRRRPSVIGDGLSTVRKLVDAENRTRAEGNPITALSLLRMEPAIRDYLHAKGQSLDDVPETGEERTLSDVINQNASRNNVALDPSAFSHLEPLGNQIRRLLPIDFLGVDIIAEDLTDPARPFTINEINTTPAFHHHVLIANRESAKPVGEMVCELMLSRRTVDR